MILILDNLRSAQNVGSILRTCDAFGISEVYFCGITPDTENPKVKKTSLGAEKTLKTKYFQNAEDAVSDLKKKSYTVAALEITDGAADIGNAKVKEPLGLVVGNEVSGIAEDVLSLCDIVIRIPMQGKKESLNVSVAFGIAAYILTR